MIIILLIAVTTMSTGDKVIFNLDMIIIIIAVTMIIVTMIKIYH